MQSFFKALWQRRLAAISLRKSKPATVPVLKARCDCCGEEKDAPSWWDGQSELICLPCKLLLTVEAKKKEAEREQMELIKRAIRELKAAGEI